MPQVKISDAKGITIQGGSGLVVQGSATLQGAVAMTNLPTSAVQAKTVNATITTPGAYTISGSTGNGILQMTMPTASSVPAGVFVFRALSADAHFLTGSAESQGTLVFKSTVTGSELQTQGSKLALAPFIGNSVALISDGKNYLVLANSGTLTFSGT